MIHLYSSNRMEWLAKKLAQTCVTYEVHVFEPDTVIVQSKGMERWLKLEVAKENSICANMICSFPQSFIRENI